MEQAEQSVGPGRGHPVTVPRVWPRWRAVRERTREEIGDAFEVSTYSALTWYFAAEDGSYEVFAAAACIPLRYSLMYPSRQRAGRVAAETRLDRPGLRLPPK